MRTRFVTLLASSAAMAAAGAHSTALANEQVMVCDVYGDHVSLQPSSSTGIATALQCPGNAEATPPSTGGMALWTRANKRVAHGKGVNWIVRPPAGLTISSVYIPHMYSNGIDDGSGWGGGFFWQGGSNGVKTVDGESGWSSAYTGSPTFSWPAAGTPYFGWQVRCTGNPCTNGGSQWLSVELLELGVRETVKPTLIAPDGLATANGWVRGKWSLHYGGDSPSGVCNLAATLNGQSLPGSTASHDYASWHQCAAPTVNEPVDLSSFGQGPLQLTLNDTDSAGNSSTFTRTIYVDDQAPTVALTGPKDAPTTAGTQYVSATAAAGPSGVDGILCSVDNAPAQPHGGAAAQIPVQGLGVHHISCVSLSNAREGSGQHGASAPATWTMSIRQPSVSTVSFARLVDRFRCGQARERVRIPAHWVKAYHQGRRVRVKLPAQTRTVNVVRCHPRVVRRRVMVNGHLVSQRVVQLPHAALVSTERLRAGHGVTLTGWLGTSAGTALGGQPVVVFAAPDNGKSQYVRVATARTRGDGSWTTRLRPGPSRVVLAAYPGTATVEPSISLPARVRVPASIALHVSPTTAHWGGRIQISGRLRGGYIPSGGELVVLWIGWRGGSTEIGHLYTRADGTFSTPYTFLRGNGTEHYQLWVASARESGYPFAPGRSRSVRITVQP